jgi:hypothetical protein
MNSLYLLDSELKAFFKVTDMDETLRRSLEKRFFNRIVETGVQIELMRYLQDEAHNYASFKPDRSIATSLTYCLLFIFVRLMNDLYDKKK